MCYMHVGTICMSILINFYCINIYKMSNGETSLNLVFKQNYLGYKYCTYVL